MGLYSDSNSSIEKVIALDLTYKTDAIDVSFLFELLNNPVR